MAKRKSDSTPPSRKRAALKMWPAARLQKALKVDDKALIVQRLDEIAKLLFNPKDASDEVIDQRIITALELYESLEPADGAEGMLALQMVGTHDAAIQCLKRAAIANQTFEGKDMNLKHAQKLMTLYTQQLATLNKHRGKGQQKVTVEHVNVEPGGKAFVGTVDASAAATREPDQTPATLEHQEAAPLDLSDMKIPTKSRKS